jgi:XTP/dITP diphosphohydrolase
VASHNSGKVREFAALLAPSGVAPVSAAELDLPEPVEDGATFLANARIKALAAAAGADRPALADDSGLVVDALGGEPGIHSARWAEPGRDFRLAMQRVQDALAAKGATEPEARAAHFTAALVLAWPDGHTEDFEGHVLGTLVWPARGNHGFGYDPMFVALGHTETFGEMEPAQKHAISLRA